ncbi:MULTISPECIES: ATP-binding protein [unclassified Haloferax]|uniref:ATP-binding protein n=1 Tax=Haloferax TaxID=2251 RepID=UPI0002B0F4AE|nr:MULTISPECIES: ATP-binding protein [unclassified Haloferax]ELZ56641.1 cell division control protein 48 [Haloferax sp. ATCC BAA-646]ELZ68086.1 cell division control protein 48 [Haloferax sp. ATCC BAA-645]ELZ68690.1 cell division control protein 48 [Haloferax sp. ATCC BAA-644]
MSERALEVVEFLLTAHLYTDDRTLDENDLPPRYRRVFWADAEDDGDEDDSSAAGIERPLVVTESVARKATGVEHPWDAISDLMFTQREEFSGRLSLTQPEMALEWFVKRADYDRLVTNPTVAKSVEDRDDVDVTHADAREQTRPIHADRVWIDSLLDEYFDDEDDAEMLDLVQVRAPEEIEMTLDDLVLTTDQEGEIHKLMKAIEHREYLADIGLREIGKILFVGPPGTGKTTVSRALAHELGLPFVEVKLSMITSQYLGETAKNVEKTFEVAKRLSPCILFIDEFDSVAKTRRSDEHAALKRAVNTLLKSIDDISLIRDEVILIGATNHPDQLDSAAWRRFDEIVNFPKPDRGMRADILRVITNRMDIDEFDPSAIADVTEGLTGSDLRLVLREAVLEALTEERMELTQDDLLEAVADFEERDNLKNLDMMSDSSELVAGSASGDGHDHSHDHDHDHADEHEGETQKDAGAAQ